MLEYLLVMVGRKERVFVTVGAVALACVLTALVAGTLSDVINECLALFGVQSFLILWVVCVLGFAAHTARERKEVPARVAGFGSGFVVIGSAFAGLLWLLAIYKLVLAASAGCVGVWQLQP